MKENDGTLPKLVELLDKDDLSFRRAFDGIAINEDVDDPQVLKSVESIARFPLIVADPPYGRIVNEDWDRTMTSESLVSTVSRWARLLEPSSAFYVWGGMGSPRDRPFLRFMLDIEERGGLTIVAPIVWSKKRAYGTSWNYLWTCEECVYLTNGDQRKPRCFNVPLLDQKRGYAGYDHDHPAKSEYLRRTLVWNESEIFRGKLHPTQKSDRVSEIPIEVHTRPGELVLDLYSGSGSTSAAARRLGRHWIAIERDKKHFDVLCNRLGAF